MLLNMRYVKRNISNDYTDYTGRKTEPESSGRRVSMFQFSTSVHSMHIPLSKKKLFDGIF